MILRLKMVKQSKGKELKNVPLSKLLDDGWHYSIKYDGNYVQIEKKDKVVRFFTSGGEEFYLPEVANELILNNPGMDFILEGEYVGSSLGKLGDRTKAAKLTTYRTEFKKGITSRAVIGKDLFKIFDLIDLTVQFDIRLSMLKLIKFGSFIEQVAYSGKLKLSQISSESFIKMGFEGLFLKHSTHMYIPGKRQNTAIKDKGNRITADLKCIDVIGGEGKYWGKIGSLVLMDSKGRQVCVGSGMSDSDRDKPYEFYIHKIIEIKYEQIIDTYIQPTFIGVREDKKVSD